MNTAHLNPASASSFPEQFSPRRRYRAAGPSPTRAPRGKAARGSTAVDDTHSRRRHVIGSALRAVRVVADTAFRVTVLGRDGVRL